MVRFGSRGRCAATAIVLAFVLPIAAQAQSIEEFYRGKQLNMIIGYPTGGSNDIYARAVARHIGRHIPGNPTVIPRNMPGGGSLVAANHVFNVAPKDGTTLALIAPTIPLEERLGVAERQAQDRRVQLDRPRGAVGEHDLRHGDGAGEDHPGHVQARGDPRRQRALVDGRDLSGGARQRDRREIQAGDGLSELDRVDAGDGARRGRRPFDQPRGRARGCIRNGCRRRRSRRWCSMRSSGIRSCRTCRCRGSLAATTRSRQILRIVANATEVGKMILSHARHPGRPRHGAAPRVRRDHEGSGVHRGAEGAARRAWSDGAAKSCRSWWSSSARCRRRSSTRSRRSIR